ncbi:hypothetical protein TWF281_007820 [Arthrobotrys megalospora]
MLVSIFTTYATPIRFTFYSLVGYAIYCLLSNVGLWLWGLFGEKPEPEADRIEKEVASRVEEQLPPMVERELASRLEGEVASRLRSERDAREQEFNSRVEDQVNFRVENAMAAKDREFESRVEMEVVARMAASREEIGPPTRVDEEAPRREREAQGGPEPRSRGPRRRRQ